MKFLQRVAAVLGIVFAVAVVAAIVAPKSARALAAALVQIVPGTTTHVGQNESQLVSLVCSPLWAGICITLNPDGTQGSAKYVVPSGYTLIVTDWEYFGIGNSGAGNPVLDNLFVTATGNGPGNLVLGGETTTIGTGSYHAHEAYTTGIRVPSGSYLGDEQGYAANAVGYVQGYLVPN